MKKQGYTTSIDIPVTPEFKAQVAELAESLGMKATEYVRNILTIVVSDQILNRERKEKDNG